ncbi:septum formation protein Maf [Paenibacillus sp. GSMTC-2017]|uniref:Maf family protein n=1 Tax=Paenibacillus sp. GSMTC-2017 TaxID=2794350 RepID=UPI0018D93FD6|nr:Maf family protein [Paenibacillus sp. GSMTC-2017]MBH5317159.1 septum formation protein Maf [Paenibacillus sp. GSMTC-2017]
MEYQPNEHEPISRIVLASSSPRRKELVASLDLSLPVYILSTDADETVQADWSPRDVVEKLSLRKAEAAKAILLSQVDSEKSYSDLIIAADTIVVLNGEILGKPQSDEEAIEMLTNLQGKQHDVYTGIVCIANSSGKMHISHRRTKVKMKPLSAERIKRYVATGEPRDKAGSYGIQGLGSTLVEEIDGCYFNVVGLPLSLLSDMLETYGINTI